MPQERDGDIVSSTRKGRAEGTKDQEDGESQREFSLSLLDESVPCLETGSPARDNSEHPIGPQCEGPPPPQTQLQMHRGNTQAL